MRGLSLHIIRFVLGIVFLVLGILGLFLPVLQGILFLMVSLLLLAPYSPQIQRLEKRMRARYPRIFARIHTMRGNIASRFRKREP